MNPARPNVLVFFTDQQRHDTTGVHGCPLDLTPNFDRMATQGTHVAHSFTCQPVCGPARSCLQTGLYATQTGCWRNNIPLARSTERSPTISATPVIRPATSANGTWATATPTARAREERGGYEYWLAANAIEMTSDAYDCVVYDNDNQAIQTARLPRGRPCRRRHPFHQRQGECDAPFICSSRFWNRTTRTTATTTRPPTATPNATLAAGPRPISPPSPDTTRLT
jgi:arylsulfatase A-like enzyme